LIFNFGITNPPSVVFFRYKGLSPIESGNILVNILKGNEINLYGIFTVIEKNNIRQRKYS